MKNILFLISITLILTSCNNQKRNITEPIQLVPDSTSVLLQIHDLETFKSDLKNNSFFKNIASSNLHNTIESVIENLEPLQTSNSVFVAFNKKQHLIITKFQDSLIATPIDSTRAHFKLIDSIAVVSSSKALLNSLSVKNNTPQFTAFEHNSNNSTFSLFLNQGNTSLLGNALFNNASTLFANNLSLDTHLTPDTFIFNAYSTPADSSAFISLFKQTIPQENKLPVIAPANSKQVSSITFDDFEQFYKNLRDFTNKETDSTQTYDLLETISEFGEIQVDNDTLLAFRSIDIFNSKELLKSEESKTGDYRNIDIYNFDTPNYFYETLYPLTQLKNASIYIVIDDFLIFANSEESIQKLITNYQNGATLQNNPNYKKLSSTLSDESSMLVLVNSNLLENMVNSISKDSSSGIDLNTHKLSGFQLVQDDGLIHTNGAITKGRSRAVSHTISEEFNVSLDADLLTSPQFVTNHRTKQKDIVVQDINNVLYLISNSGKVLWKKQLQGAILGSVQQVDLYKNGRLQLAFATSNRVYIIDRNGNNVSPFPLKLNNPITQPLSIFDYDNNKNYRFAISQNNVLLMYDKRGRRVSGFNYRNSNNAIVTQPKHFRVSGKDYIVFGAGNRLQILNRRGQSRVSTNESIDFSGNPIFRYQNAFTTTSSKGELVQVNLKGQVSKQTLQLDSKHQIDATSRTLVSISDNNLSIKQKSQELDFGNYTAPRIFYINDKIYVGITDLQTQKAYLFDSQSRLISNFPIYANSTIDLANMDRDNNLEIVTQGEHNSVLVYQKN